MTDEAIRRVERALERELALKGKTLRGWALDLLQRDGANWLWVSAAAEHFLGPRNSRRLMIAVLRDRELSREARDAWVTGQGLRDTLLRDLRARYHLPVDPPAEVVSAWRESARLQTCVMLEHPTFAEVGDDQEPSRFPELNGLTFDDVLRRLVRETAAANAIDLRPWIDPPPTTPAA